MEHEELPADDGRRYSQGGIGFASGQPARAAGSLTLYVHEAPGGLRELSGGGITADGICADIRAILYPGGAWNGLRYEDLLPGRYDIVGNTFVRADGRVLSGE